MTKRKILLLTQYHDPISFWTNRAREVGYEVNILSIQSLDLLSQNVLADISLVIEWLSPDQQLKENALRKIDSHLNKDVVLLSATHEVMATTVATWLQFPERLIGFSPLGLYRESSHVTLTKPFGSSDASIEKIENFFKTLNLQPHWINDTPGMILPRIYAMLVNEAAFALQENVATAADIDTAMRLGTNYPMGPLAWADKIGVDVVACILENLWHIYREERYRPCLLLQKMVAAGHLGIKSGQGFYHYDQSAFSLTEKAEKTRKVEVSP